MTPAWVLVVDDDASDRMLLFRLVEACGHHATVAESERQALELLRVEPFELVLIALLRPNLDGYAVLAAIRTDPSLRVTPVIMVSPNDEQAEVLRCIELGAEDHLEKPLDPVLLRNRINTTLERHRLRHRQQALP